MVQFCPKCGTKEPDENAVFCHKCGNRLPSRIPEKKDIFCPACGTKIRDMQAVFCDTCGSSLRPPVYIQPAAVPRAVTAPVRVPQVAVPRAAAPVQVPQVAIPPVTPAPVQVPQAAVPRTVTAPVQVPQVAIPPAAPAPLREKEHCPSCGVAVAEEGMDYCNECGANLRTAVPAAPGEKNLPPPEKTGPGADRPAGGNTAPAPKKSRRSFLKWVLLAGVAVLVLALAGASLSGMIPGFTLLSNTTPSPANETPLTALTTPATTETAAPAATPSPEQTTAPVPTTVVTTTAEATVTANASATVPTNASATTVTNATANVTAAMTLTSTSQPLSVGQSAYDGKGTLTVNGYSFKDKMSDPVPSYAVGRQYLIVNITYENLQQNETMDVDLSAMKVVDGGGYPYDPVSDNALENVYTGISILPLEKRTGNLLFVVPPGAMYLKLEYRFGNQNPLTFTLT
jgi:hypothetical protein